MTFTAVVAADAAPEAGLGHLSRSAAVCAALAVRGVQLRSFGIGAERAVEHRGVRFEPADGPAELEAAAGDAVLVLDSYALDRADVEALCEARPTVLMHDATGPAPEAARLVVSSSAASPSSGKRLAGPRFACLEPRYWGAARRKIAPEVRVVAVSLGGGSTQQAEVIADALAAELSGAHVELLHSRPSLFDPLLAADLAVTGGGQTMLEAAAAGTPVVAAIVADNQRPQTEWLAECGGAVAAEAGDAAGTVALAAALARDHGRRERMSLAAQEAVDGFGALRVGFAIERIAAELSR